MLKSASYVVYRLKRMCRRSRAETPEKVDEMRFVLGEVREC